MSSNWSYIALQNKAPLWSQIDPVAIQMRSWSDREVIQNWPRNDPEVTQKWPRIDPIALQNEAPIWPQIDSEVTPTPKLPRNNLNVWDLII